MARAPLEVQEQMIAGITELLPELIRGITSLITELDSHKFVSALRFTQSSLKDQKARFSTIFDTIELQNFEKLGPLFHMMDLVLQTENMKAAVLNILEEANLLNLPTYCTDLLQLFMSLRHTSAPAVTSSTSRLSVHLASWNERKTLFAKCMKYLELPEDSQILLEIIAAIVLQDARALTWKGVGQRLGNFCIQLLSGKTYFVPDGTDSVSGLKWQRVGPRRRGAGRELPNDALAEALKSKTEFTQTEWEAFGIKDLQSDHFIATRGLVNSDVMTSGMRGVLGLCYQVAMMLLATFAMDGVSFKSFAQRFNVEQSFVDELKELLFTSYKHQRPIPNMRKYKLVKATSSHVGLKPTEAAGLLHLLKGCADTPEALGLIREAFRRQNIDPQRLERFTTDIITMSFGLNERETLLALQELNITDRYLSLLGMNFVPPRYISETQLRAAGVRNEEVLAARLEVPFTYESDPAAWEEWLKKAAMCIRGVQNIGPWKSRCLKGYNGLQAKLEKASVKAGEKREDPEASLQRQLSTLTDSFRKKSETGKLLSLEDLAQVQRQREELSAQSREQAEAERREHQHKLRSAVHSVTAALELSPAVSSQHGQSPGNAATSIAPEKSVPESAKLATDVDNRNVQHPLVVLPEELSIKRSSSTSSQIVENVAEDEDTAASQEIFAMQISSAFSSLTDPILQKVASYYNTRIERRNTKAARHTSLDVQQYALVRSRTQQALLKKKASVVESPGSEAITKRRLGQLQDSNTGLLEPVYLNAIERSVVLKLLSITKAVKAINKSSESGSSLVRASVKEYAELLNVPHQELTDIFALVLPSRSRDIPRHLEAICNKEFPDRLITQLGQLGYAMKRAEPFADEARQLLWTMTWKFHMPRFLGPCVIFPELAYPPEIKEVFSICYFFMSSLLASKKHNTTIQIVLYHLAGLLCGATHSARILGRCFGLVSSAGQKRAMSREGLRDAFEDVDEEVLSADAILNQLKTDLMQMMVRPMVVEKLRILPRIINKIMEHDFKELDTAIDPSELQEMTRQVFPYLLFFTGFPSAIVPATLCTSGNSWQSALELISDETGIHTEILQGIDISQHSISALSGSDTTKLDHTSSLGLLVPLMAKIRSALPVIAGSLPSDKLVKALVSLSCRSIENLEHLAEECNLNTFLLQLLVLLVDIASAPNRRSKILYQVQRSTGIQKAIENLGLQSDQFLPMLELSFPTLESVTTVKRNLFRANLSQFAHGRVLEFIYMSAACALLHVRGVTEPQKHEEANQVLSKWLKANASDMGFRTSMVPLLAMRLFQGNFLVLSSKLATNLLQDVQGLLPFSLERDLAMCVSGLLSHKPPRFPYYPVVVSGVVHIRIPKNDRNDSERQDESVWVYTDSPLPDRPRFSFKAIPTPGSGATAGDFKFSLPEVSADGMGFSVKIELFPEGLKGKEIAVHWQAVPKDLNSHDLTQRQREAATNGLKELEELSWHPHVHWGGVASVWWDELDVHPLFLLLAIGDPGAIRLAADLLGLPEVIIAFLLSIVQQAPAEKLKPLLLADLAMPQMLRKVKENWTSFDSNQLDPPPLDPSYVRVRNGKLRKCGFSPTRRREDTKSKIEGAASSQVFGYQHVQEGSDDDPDTDDQEQIDEEEEEEREEEKERVPEGGVDGGVAAATLGQTASEIELRQMRDGRSKLRSATTRFIDNDFENVDLKDFPDELLDLYNIDDDQLSCDQLWQRWRYSSAGLEHMAISSFLDRSALACLQDIYDDTTASEERSPIDERTANWKSVPRNLHLLLSTILMQLHTLLEDVPEFRRKADRCAPSVSLLVSLSRLNQAREFGAKSKAEMSAANAERFIMPAMWGIEAHFRSRHRGFRRKLALELGKNDLGNQTKNSAAPLWVSHSYGGFELPKGSPSKRHDFFDSEEWEWPEDELLEMCCRIAQVSRFALGVSKPLTCYHARDEGVCKHIKGERTPPGLRSHLQRRGWSILPREAEAHNAGSTGGEDLKFHPVGALQEEPMSDVLRRYSIELALAVASAGADCLEANYSIQKVSDRVDADVFVGKASYLDALAYMLATPFDTATKCTSSLACPHCGLPLKRARTSAFTWACCGKYNPGGCRSARGTLENHDECVVYHCQNCVLSDLQSIDPYDDGRKDSWRQLQERIAAGEIVGVHYCEPCVQDMMDLDYQAPWDDSPAHRMSSLGAALGKLLPDETQLGRRTSQWASTLCWDVGFDQGFASFAFLVAHDLMEDSQGIMLNPDVVADMSTRFGLGSTGAGLLQTICTKDWHYKSTTVLAKSLNLIPVVVYNILRAAAGDPIGWIRLHKSLQSQDSAQEAATAQFLSSSEKANRMLEACADFSTHCMRPQEWTSVRQEMDWLSEVLKRLVPNLLGLEAPLRSEHRLVQVVISIMQLAGHLLSGQNVAAANVLGDDPGLRSALGFNEQSATYLQNCALLMHSSTKTTKSMHPEAIEEACTNLTKNVVKYILDTSDERGMCCALPTDSSESTAESLEYSPEWTIELSSKFEEWGWKQGQHIDAVTKHGTRVLVRWNHGAAQILGTQPSESDFPLEFRAYEGMEPGIFEQKLNIKMKCLLRCLFGVALEKNQKVLQAMRESMTEEAKEKLTGIEGKHKQDAMSLLESQGSLEAITEQPVTKEVTDLMERCQYVQELVVLQGLFAVRRIVAQRARTGISRKTSHSGGSGISGIVTRLHTLTDKEVVEDAASATGESISPILAEAMDRLRCFAQGFGIKLSPSAFEVKCANGHVMRARSPDGRLWECAGHRDPGGCLSASQKSKSIKECRFTSDGDCQYNLCEACYINMFRLVVGAKNEDLNGLYTADRKLKTCHKKHIYLRTTPEKHFRLKRFSDDQLWCIESANSPESLGSLSEDCAEEFPIHPECSSPWQRQAFQVVSREGSKAAWQEDDADAAHDQKVTALEIKKISIAASKETREAAKAHHAISYFFIAFLLTDRSGIADSPELTPFLDEFKKLLPLIAGVATGRIEELFDGLRSLTAGTQYFEDMELLNELLTMTGVDRDLFLRRMQSSKDVKWLPVFVRRVCKLLGPKRHTQNLEDIVNQLANLLFALMVDAPSPLMGQMLGDLISPLEDYARTLLKGDERMVNAAMDLIDLVRFIAAKVHHGKSVSQINFFKPAAEGEPPLMMAILTAVLDLLLPSLGPEIREPLKSMIEALAALYELGMQPSLSSFQENAPVIAVNIAAALGTPVHNVKGVFALARGDWAEAVDLCRPFCDLDPEAMKHVAKFLPLVKSSIKVGLDLARQVGNQQVDEHFNARVRQIAGSAHEGNATVNDLFDIIDVDKSGTISVEEFKVCTRRLGIQLSEHRLYETLSHCKQTTRRGDLLIAELTPEEFKNALEFVKKKVANSSLAVLGLTSPWILVRLAVLTCVLCLIFVFIWLGMDAFVSGGTFSAVVNSLLTISAGIGLAARNSNTRAESDSTKSVSGVVDEVKAIVQSEH
eukprot:TRINITY_DN93109_c0_g1_i1.p1 TRINITY_DN93109_c0_g1~~TRINITY_DN93109_c0_g1_i1.p1  ORF type:complete len:3900 (+),score=642.63 TRINITY_DN93109_c0_g1_i1:1334-11701(+)